MGQAPGTIQRMSPPPESGLPANIGAPATRALIAAGYSELRQLASVPTSELRKLHGVGPKALKLLQEASSSRACLSARTCAGLRQHPRGHQCGYERVLRAQARPDLCAGSNMPIGAAPTQGDYALSEKPGKALSGALLATILCLLFDVIAGRRRRLPSVT